MEFCKAGGPRKVVAKFPPSRKNTELREAAGGRSPLLSAWHLSLRGSFHAPTQRQQGGHPVHRQQ